MSKFALGIAADTGLWLKPVQYERKARPVGKRPTADFMIFMIALIDCPGRDFFALR